MNFIRSMLFALGLALVTPPYSFIALAVRRLPPMRRYRIISGWGRSVSWMSRYILGIRINMVGTENIPSGPMVIVANHQSAWETIVFSTLFPPHVWVLKRELLSIPFFGWGLASVSPVAIDRESGRAALRQVLQQGRERIAWGFSMLVFPEGTRVAPKVHKRFQQGAAALAISAGVPVLPVAHDAGHLWPRNAWIKRAGTVTVVVGQPIDTSGRATAELSDEVEGWIRQRMAELEAARP